MKNNTLLLVGVAVAGYLLYRRYSVAIGPASAPAVPTGLVTLPGVASSYVAPNTGGIDVLPVAPKLSFSTINDL